MVFDMADPMRQLGVLPPAGSRAEQAIARVAGLLGRFRRR
jgi:hypothetical protein